MPFTLEQHPIGRLSRCAVLDVGLKCPHSCEFCYYSFLDGSDDQFRGMRTAPFKPLAECRKALDFFVESGFERIDITGGEPAMHPDIFEIVRYAEQEAGLRVRLITLAQLLERKEKYTGKRLLDALLEDAGMTDFLFSLHAVDPDLYHKMTKGKFARVEAVLDELDGRGFDYCTNTVACASNAGHLPEIAAYITERGRRAYVSNFITMNAYMAWSGRAFGVQARYSDLAASAPAGGGDSRGRRHRRQRPLWTVLRLPGAREEPGRGDGRGVRSVRVAQQYAESVHGARRTTRRSRLRSTGASFRSTTRSSLTSATTAPSRASATASTRATAPSMATANWRRTPGCPSRTSSTSAAAIRPSSSSSRRRTGAATMSGATPANVRSKAWVCSPPG